MFVTLNIGTVCEIMDFIVLYGFSLNYIYKYLWMQFSRG